MFRNQLKGARTETALASATSAENADRKGATLSTNKVDDGSLAVHLDVTIVTGSVVATLRHEVSDDGTTFYPLVQPNNAANVTTTATAIKKIDVPQSWKRYRYYRCVVTLSGAATAGGDLTAANYEYLQYGTEAAR